MSQVQLLDPQFCKTISFWLRNNDSPLNLERKIDDYGVDYRYSYQYKSRLKSRKFGMGNYIHHISIMHVNYRNLPSPSSVAYGLGVVKMGWSIGYDTHWARDIGYGVIAYCDHPKCNKEIDRGLAYVCGGHPYGGEHGCGLYFCAEHLIIGFQGREEATQLCPKCARYDYQPYKPKPEHPEWIKWKMTDPSWAEWRKEKGIQ